MATFTFKKPAGAGSAISKSGATYTNSLRNYNNKDAEDKKWNFFISYAKYDTNNRLHYYLKGFKWDDSRLIEYASQHLARVVTGGTSSEIVVRQEDIDKFLDIVPNIINELKKKGGYSDRTYAELGGQFKKFAESTPTFEEITEVQNNIANNWRDLMIRLKSPQNRDNFLKFQASKEYMRIFGGEPLSEKNIAEVLMADPQATFVTNAYTWLSVFRRKIIGTPTKIIITKPVYKYVSKDALDKAAKDSSAANYQFKNYSDAKKQLKGNEQALFGIKKRASKEEQSSKSFYKDKVIDVRFTEPIDPKDDPFTQIAGLVNNLKGELNQIALKKLAESGDENLKAQINQQLDVSDVNTSLFEKFNNFIIEKCKNLKADTVNTGNAIDDLVTNLYNCGYKLAESYNNLTPQSKSLFANIICATVGLTLNIPNNLKMQQAWNVIEHMMPEDLDNIVMTSFQAYKSIVSFNSEYTSINEDFSMENAVQPMSFSEFKTVLVKNNKNMSKSINNNFYDMLNRMSNVGSDEYYNYDRKKDIDYN